VLVRAACARPRGCATRRSARTSPSKKEHLARGGGGQARGRVRQGQRQGGARAMLSRVALSSRRHVQAAARAPRHTHLQLYFSMPKTFTNMPSPAFQRGSPGRGAEEGGSGAGHGGASGPACVRQGPCTHARAGSRARACCARDARGGGAQQARCVRVPQRRGGRTHRRPASRRRTACSPWPGRSRRHTAGWAPTRRARRTQRRATASSWPSPTLRRRLPWRLRRRRRKGRGLGVRAPRSKTSPRTQLRACARPAPPRGARNAPALRRAPRGRGG
jgi:hypothetical protein